MISNAEMDGNDTGLSFKSIHPVLIVAQFVWVLSAMLSIVGGNEYLVMYVEPVISLIVPLVILGWHIYQQDLSNLALLAFVPHGILFSSQALLSVVNLPLYHFYYQILLLPLIWLAYFGAYPLYIKLRNTGDVSERHIRGMIRVVLLGIFPVSLFSISRVGYDFAYVTVFRVAFGLLVGWYTIVLFLSILARQQSDHADYSYLFIDVNGT